jgi:hypothetical protein
MLISVGAALRVGEADADGRTRDAKSLRQTGISLRLELGLNPDYRDIAKWPRTSPATIAAFYDQTHPQLSVERIAGFRKHRSGKKISQPSRNPPGNSGTTLRPPRRSLKEAPTFPTPSAAYAAIPHPSRSAPQGARIIFLRASVGAKSWQ